MTADQKREAWVRFAAEVAAVGVSFDGRITTETTTNATLAHYCGVVADALLSEVEQREREGRFGAEKVPPPAGYDLAGWANPNAVKRYEEAIERAEAEVERLTRALSESDKQRHEEASEVERLKAELEAERAAYRQSQLASEETRWQDGEEADDGLARAELEGRANKAESFLKEALGSAGGLMDALGHLVKYGRPAQGGEQSGNVAHIEQAMGAVGKVLARARQEGFSNGE